MNTLPSTDIARSNSLADLAARINAEHEAVNIALKDSVHHAIAAGAMLIDAKARVSHGEWSGWLRNRCSLTERTAQRYMRLARNKVEIESKTTCVSDLSLNGALALLTIPRDQLVDDAVQSVVATLDTSNGIVEALKSMAEIARRKVVLDAAARNMEIIHEIIKTHPVPHRDGPHPLDEVWSELKTDFEGVSIAYAEAVESNDYEHAFALAGSLHGWTAEMRTLAEAWDVRAGNAPLEDAS